MARYKSQMDIINQYNRIYEGTREAYQRETRNANLWSNAAVAAERKRNARQQRARQVMERYYNNMSNTPQGKADWKRYNEIPQGSYSPKYNMYQSQAEYELRNRKYPRSAYMGTTSTRTVARSQSRGFVAS